MGTEKSSGRAQGAAVVSRPRVLSSLRRRSSVSLSPTLSPAGDSPDAFTIGTMSKGRPSFDDDGPRSSSEVGDELDTLISARPSLDGLSPTLPTYHHYRRSSSQSDRWQIPALPSRYLNWFRNTATLLLLVYTFVAVFALYWVAKFFILRHEAYAHSIFSPPMIPNPHSVEPLVAPVSLPANASLSSLQAELDRRLESLGLSASTLPCSWTEHDELKYTYLQGQGPYFFALNLWNNEEVFPTLARTLLSLSAFLGPANVAVSIFENGSTDNTTMAMGHFAAVLTAAAVDHTIISDERKTEWKKVDRIAQLSVYRNLALAPVNSSSTKFQDIIFINDVFVCPKDTLELLHQKRLQQADASCAMDWRATHSWLGFLGFSSVKFYDSWVRTLVARTITGDMFRSRFDLLSETRDGVSELFDQPGSEYSRARFLAAQPVPVYSCWNGMLAISAAPFRGEDGPAVTFRSAFNKPGECAASECKTVARDFWAQGLRRWIIVPSVHVTYDESVYSHPSLVGLNPVARAKKAALPELIDWPSIQPPTAVMCYEWVRGFHLDLPYRRTKQSPF